MHLGMIFLIGVILVIHQSCGGDNIFSCPSQVNGVPCTEKSPIEQAKDAIDAGEIAKAEEILLEEIAALQAGDYHLHPLLAAAYARGAGIDIFNLVQLKDANGGSLTDIVTQFLPDPLAVTEEQYDAYLAYVEKAVQVLEEIPSAERSAESGTTYGSSAQFQYTLYTTCFSVMLLNQFALPDPNDPSSLDLDALQSMSAEDALKIVGNLEKALANSDAALPINKGLTTTLETIEAQPGATLKDQLINYMQEN